MTRPRPAWQAAGEKIAAAVETISETKRGRAAIDEGIETLEPSAGPVGEAQRIAVLDLARGIAVLGIVFANITAFAHPIAAYFWPPALGTGASPADQAVWLFQFIAVDGKFRAIFTLLFGAGLALFYQRARLRHRIPRRLLLRRLAILLLVGLAHFFLVWSGDILTLYALWGMAAMLTLDWPAGHQLTIGLVALFVGAVAMAAMMGAVYVYARIGAFNASLPAEARADLAMGAALALEQAQQELRVYSSPSYLDILGHQLSLWRDLLGQWLIVGPSETFGLILVGSAMYRKGFFTGAIDRQALRRWGWAGLLTGWSLSALLGLWVVARGFEFYTTQLAFVALAMIPNLVSGFSMLALIVAYAPRLAASGLGARLVAAGRMAFSNYLGTSLVMMPLFHGWGLGLYGALDRVQLLWFVAGVWALMLAWSKAWLARFRYGPLEWLWRCLTYRKWIALRRNREDQSPA